MALTCIAQNLLAEAREYLEKAMRYTKDKYNFEHPQKTHWSRILDEASTQEREIRDTEGTEGFRMEGNGVRVFFRVLLPTREIDYDAKGSMHKE